MKQVDKYRIKVDYGDDTEIVGVYIAHEGFPGETPTKHWWHYWTKCIN